MIEQHHLEELNSLKRENFNIEKVVSSKENLKFNISNAQIKDIHDTLMSIDQNIKTQDVQLEQIDFFKERISQLENRIENQQHQFSIEKSKIETNFETALKEEQIMQRFDYEAKLGAKEMELLQQIDDLNEKLSKEIAKSSNLKINENLLLEKDKRLEQISNLVIDHQDIQNDLKNQIDIKNHELKHLSQKTIHLEHIVSKNSIRMSDRSFHI